MHSKLLTAVLLPALLLAAGKARSDETLSAGAKEPADTQVANAVVEQATGDEAAPAAANADAEAKITLPPGFKPKKRGKYTLYCRKEAVVGTRFPTEKCYDETGIREMMKAMLEDREKVDQMRRICGSMDACGGGG